MYHLATSWLRLAAVCCAAALSSGCATIMENIQTPTVQLVGLQLVEAGLLEQKYRLTLSVDNPNSISLPIKGLNYSVSLAGIDFATGEAPRSFSIAGNSASEVEVDVSTNLVDSLRRLADWFSGAPKALDYELTGEVQVDIPFVGAVPFSESGSINIDTGN
ncbi:MAG: LEA type 2 family protein [Pseudomonadota bacterium]